ncbi:enoyl-CoA hydratase/isomerase family protein [Microbacterium cremeum]|uniref:enoyl-CoA hydratase/isomerase family protein n=1 Tax=Microbacterium cremeum TaxID=2782169 RepID=UPI001E64DC0D|nr:enoyl-CoA hydratase/isomerase family protein [Microbacterium cremeum]
MPTILRDDRADRLWVRLHRPEARNAIDRAMVDELHEVCDELEREPRILLIGGSDGVFAGGADIAELRDRTPADAREGINSRLFDRLARLPMPVIAVVDGWALGGGAELAYAADLRIASDRARFGSPEPSLGIVPAAGATWRLPRLVGEPLAKHMLLAGRVLDAREALAAGLVVAVHDPSELDAAADALVDRIAALDPLAIRHTKRLIDDPTDDPRAAAEAAQAECFGSPAKYERMTAWLDRRPERKNA